MEPQPVDLIDIAAFVEVVRTGGFARAAERIGASKSIVSRRVARLEQRLGARLLVRTARGAQPTEIGQDYHRRLTGVLTELELAHEAVALATSEVSGTIRLTAPISFGVAHLTPALAAFAAAHPRIELDLSFDDRRVDLVDGRFDLAVRVGQLADSSLVARKLGDVTAVTVASPDYLARAGRPRTPRDLVGHEALFYSNVGPGQEWRFRVADRWERVRANGRVRADNGDALREMAAAGLGIAVLPQFIVESALADGRLTTILDDYPLGSGGLYAVMPPGRGSTARVRALVEHLARWYAPGGNGRLQLAGAVPVPR